ncbi:MAG: pyridoxamine 5'-phosphate oxidase family protein [Bacillota bacterium]|jgi:nitroimidazol reductase NimA-like FMN-containing flavoprotein (pyridoxamine 5'-phosphate oxidase superfamily)
MRRKDREIVDEEQIVEIVKSCDCCRLGMVADGMAYIVPLNFAFAEEDGKRVFYFHSAKTGKKIDLLREQNTVGFEMDCKHSLKTGENPCNYGFCFQSVMGGGSVSFVTSPTEKKHALCLLMTRYIGQKVWSFSDEQANKVEIIKLEVTEWSCKQCD